MEPPSKQGMIETKRILERACITLDDNAWTFRFLGEQAVKKLERAEDLPYTFLTAITDLRKKREIEVGVNSAGEVTHIHILGVYRPVTAL